MCDRTQVTRINGDGSPVFGPAHQLVLITGDGKFGVLPGCDILGIPRQSENRTYPFSEPYVESEGVMPGSL